MNRRLPKDCGRANSWKCLPPGLKAGGSMLAGPQHRARITLCLVPGPTWVADQGRLGAARIASGRRGAGGSEEFEGGVRRPRARPGRTRPRIVRSKSERTEVPLRAPLRGAR